MLELHENEIFADNYLLKKYLGGGSFGDVWLGENLNAGVDVAIKIYNQLDNRGVDDFRSEFKIAFELNHSNLLHISHYDVCDGHPFLVMLYCPNGSSESLIGRIDEATVWRFLRDVANGLEYLHNQTPPIVHQDIKPANILTDKNGNFMITDFGISKQIRSSLRKSVQQSAISGGTTAYMGPERFSKHPSPIMASDIWSLGATIFELITGDVPFGNIGGGMMINGAVVPEIEANYSEELKLVIEKCLAKEPWNRPTAEQLSKYAQKILDGETPTPWQNETQEQTTSNNNSGRPTQRITSSPPQENDFGKTTQEQKIIGSLYTFSDGSKGIVFYLNSYGHGLAVSLDEEYLLWSKSDSDILNIPNESVFNKSLNMGLGATYTTYIINQLGSGNAPAADWCRVKGSEWYLPSAGELWQLLTVANEERGKSGPISEALKSNGGVSLYGCYWSSSEYSYFSAWNVYVRGGVDYYGKDNNYNRVRAVRAF